MRDPKSRSNCRVVRSSETSPLPQRIAVADAERGVRWASASSRPGWHLPSGSDRSWPRVLNLPPALSLWSEGGGVGDVRPLGRRRGVLRPLNSRGRSGVAGVEVRGGSATSPSLREDFRAPDTLFASLSLYGLWGRRRDRDLGRLPLLPLSALPSASSSTPLLPLDERSVL